jgi:hypothetical protein
MRQILIRSTRIAVFLGWALGALGQRQRADRCGQRAGKLGQLAIDG